jgi:hypothetical protein
MTITPAQPILANSSREVLRERRNAQGTFQVAWIPQLDAHGLFFTHAGGTCVLATHNNGHSCANLADRICSGDLERAMDQRQYIQDCGGLVGDAAKVAFAVNGITERKYCTAK